MLVNTDAPVCLVFGVNGQDGSYLAEKLLTEGYRVIGVGRQVTSRWLSQSCKSFTYHQCDLCKVDSVVDLIEKFSPDYIYHAAAIHGSSGFNYETVWHSAHAVNSLTTHAVLEYCRKNVKTRFIYLSSSKVFDFSNGDLVTENTARKSDCIYTITKNTSTNLIDYYRKSHSVNASVVYTFNHESHRRSRNFFIPKIVNILRESIRDQSYREGISNLSFFCDWGSAEEYMDLVFDISHKAIGSDFIIATGVTLCGRDFVSELFSRYGLLAKEHIYETSPLIDQKNNHLLWHASCEKLNKEISRKPKKNIYEVCDEILNSLQDK